MLQSLKLQNKEIKMINKDIETSDNPCFLNMLGKCNLCPRKCFVNRLDGELGYCKASNRCKNS